MLAKKYRLKKKKDFERVYKQGDGAREGFFMLRFLLNDLKNPRFGIVIGKKVANKANVRNLIKRRIREVIRKLLPEIRINSDIIIIGLKGIDKETSFQDIQKNISKLFLRKGIIEKVIEKNRK